MLYFKQLAKNNRQQRVLGKLTVLGWLFEYSNSSMTHENGPIEDYFFSRSLISVSSSSWVGPGGGAGAASSSFFLDFS